MVGREHGGPSLGWGRQEEWHVSYVLKDDEEGAGQKGKSQRGSVELKGSGTSGKGAVGAPRQAAG